jgi:type II pantothenate kinase
VTGAFGKIVQENKIPVSTIKGIKITGAGASKIKDDIFGIPTSFVNEIDDVSFGYG